MSVACDTERCPSIPRAVLASAEAHADRPALLKWTGSNWKPLSYRELTLRVERVAAALVRKGLRPGDRVALVGRNSPDWGVAYLAVQLAGGVAMPLDRLQTPEEWLDIIERAEARTLFAAQAELGKLQSHARAGVALDRAFIIDAHEPAQLPSIDDLASEPGEAVLPPRDTDDLAALIFTSGTTGRSKGVMLSHRNILSNALAVIDVVHVDPSRDAFLSVLPMNHCYECTCGFLVPLLAGARVYFARGLAPTEMLDDLRTSRATFLLGVPLVYGKMAAGIARGLRDKGTMGRLAAALWSFSRTGRKLWGHRFGRLALGSVRARAGMDSLRYLISGAAPLPPDVGFDLEALGLKFLQGYGLTETSPVASLNPPRRPNPASVGKPLPGVEIRLNEPDASGVGEIWIRGPIVTQGYWQDDEATRSVIEDGWFKTGDLGRFDRRGYLYIAGRRKNLIVSAGGKNISPEEIELAAERSPYIAEILVCAVPASRGGGEEVFAYVYPDFDHLAASGQPSEPGPGLQKLIRAELDGATSQLAPYKRIVRFEIVTEPFIKTTTQKIKRHLHMRKIGVDAPK